MLTTPQRAKVGVRGHEGEVLNLCANNYLGLDHPEVIAAAHAAMEEWGGLASVRFICGTQELHKDLEDALSAFLGMEDTILYGSCFDANGGLFEVLLGEDDAVISDELNHASIIDGVRLSKAKRLRYRNNDMDDLETQLKEAAGARRRLIATDGVFSMDGYLADLPAICDLAERHDAMVMVDDSHAVGFMGTGGRGTPEHHGVMDRVDILTGTMGKALGGASGGYLSGPREWWSCSANDRVPTLLEHDRARGGGRIVEGDRALRPPRSSATGSRTTRGSSGPRWRPPGSMCCRASIRSCP